MSQLFEAIVRSGADTLKHEYQIRQRLKMSCRGCFGNSEKFLNIPVSAPAVFLYEFDNLDIFFVKFKVVVESLVIPVDSQNYPGQLVAEDRRYSGVTQGIGYNFESTLPPSLYVRKKESRSSRLKTSVLRKPWSWRDSAPRLTTR